MRIAEIIVNNEYQKGNNRFFLYVDMDEGKIRGELNQDLMTAGIEQYVNEKHNELTKSYLVQRENGKKKHNAETAKAEIMKRLQTQYFQ